MEDSIIYDYLDPKMLYPYREELKKADGSLTNWEREEKEKLVKSLNEEQKNLLDTYLHSLSLLEEDIDLQVGIRTLNYGIKIGMRLQRSLKDL